MKSAKVFFLILLVIVIFVGSGSIYILKETEQAVRTRFGPIKGVYKNAGIHFKVPFIDKVEKYEKRLLEWDGEPQEVPTSDNKFIHIDSFARWRISNPQRFYKSTKNEDRAHTFLDDIIESTARDEIASYSLPEIIRTSERDMAILKIEAEQNNVGAPGEAEIVKGGAREIITQNVLRRVTEKLLEQNLGIEVVDFRFKRIDYNRDVQEKVFQRMISEQKRIAEKYRAIGEGQKQYIYGKVEQKKKEILSGAYLKSQTIRGEADAKAIEIYANAYNKSAESRDFYNFLRTLDAYKNSFDSTTSMILSTDNEFLKFLESSKN